MRVLVFEFISGGGLSGQPLPASLAQEGRLMLQALLDDFSDLDGVYVSVMLDARLSDGIRTHGAHVITVKPGQDYWQPFLAAVQHSDAVWPIAPESDGVLQRLCQAATALGKRLLTSPADAVALTGDKYLTFLHLHQHQIPTVPTQLLADADLVPGEYLVKVIDGAGCSDSQIVSDWPGFLATAATPERFIVQPHVHGQKTSLSGLCRQGQAWLLSVNLQQFSVADNRYRLTGLIVNQQTDDGSRQRLLAAIAAAIPRLWGYIGVDLIETAAGPLVLEINPRLTTSFTGLRRALGVNVAGLVLRLHHAAPSLDFPANRTVHLVL